MNKRPSFMKLLLPGASDEQVEEALINLLREIETQRFLCPLERPDFGPTQVRSVEEMVPGKTYNICYDHLNSKEPYVFHGVVTEKHGRALEMTSVRFGRRSTIHFLTDCGLAPYQYGNWNPSNWVERLP